tara:strand:- start:3348 stop:3962 length:615 start_codon:yes stop_codon:yes gene_type:complete
MISPKNLYDWVLSWSESAYGKFVLFLIAFAESSFFPVPADPLLMALCLGKVKRSMYYVFICTSGSVLGGVFGFIIGYFLWYTPSGQLTGIANFFFNIIPGFTYEVFDNVGAQYDAHNFLVIFTAAFTPIPYKVFSITAGVFQINLPTFIIASILGRGGRFLIIGLLIKFFGKPIKSMMDKHFNKFIIVLTTIFALSYVLIGYLF